MWNQSGPESMGGVRPRLPAKKTVEAQNDHKIKHRLQDPPE